jgi:hypothetical protein
LKDQKTRRDKKTIQIASLIVKNGFKKRNQNRKDLFKQLVRGVNFSLSVPNAIKIRSVLLNMIVLVTSGVVALFCVYLHVTHYVVCHFVLNVVITLSMCVLNAGKLQETLEYDSF